MKKRDHQVPPNLSLLGFREPISLFLQQPMAYPRAFDLLGSQKSQMQ